MMHGVIRKQVRLPVSVAFGVVMQGIRIRLGRSIVTLMGVMLGIAFLMSILTGQTIRHGVSQEEDARTEAKRVMSFLTAETGPLDDRVVGIWAVGALNDGERRLVAALRRAGVARVQWAGEAIPSGNGEWVRACAPEAVGKGAVAVVVVGDGTVPAVAWREALAGADQKVVGFSRKSLAGGDTAGVTATVLEREWQPDEVRDREIRARRLAFRTAWIIIISLLVTVIGISNAMLMSVTERFREIGTMKCLGALSAFIRQIFFIEASLLGAAGSLAGCVLGYAFSAAAYMFTYGVDLVGAALSPVTGLEHAALCLVAGVVLSVVAAIYPAGVASRMVPANALRSTV